MDKHNIPTVRMLEYTEIIDVENIESATTFWSITGINHMLMREMLFATSSTHSNG
jgi:hypothetical protein